jgi:lipoyl(octanoyl) transferase
MVEWITTDGLTDYETAVAFMEERAAAIAAGEAGECIWLVEHPPLYTAGTSARREDLTDPDRFPVYESKRGGQYTYHGPGQRVVYVMLDVGKRGHDVRLFVQQLERWVILALEEFNVHGAIREGRVGVWVERDDKPLTITGQKTRRQNCGDWYSVAQMGQLPRDFGQCGTRSGSLHRHRTLRNH